MAQTDRDTVPPSSPAQQAYRPISGLAVTGLVLACLFALLVGITSGVGLIQGAPFFLPEWLLGLPVAAIVLCFVAQQRIRNSEATLAGMKPARWGLWIALLTALGYFAFSFFTGLAITQQADSFLRVQGPDSGFFPRLQEGNDRPEQIDQAFMLTLKVSERPTSVKDLPKVFDRPSKEGPVGPLSRFRNHFLIRTIARNGPDAHIAALGGQQWSYENHGYKVQRHYRVTTAEAVFDLRPVTQSVEIPGSQRKWLAVYPFETRVALTPVGIGLKSAWTSANSAVESLLQGAGQGKPVGKFRDDTDWQKLAPGPVVQELRERLLGFFTKTSAESNMRGGLAREEHIGPWEIINGRLRFRIGISVNFMGSDGRPYLADGELLVEGGKRHLQSTDELAELPANPETEWRILAVKFRVAMPMQM